MSRSRIPCALLMLLASGVFAALIAALSGCSEGASAGPAAPPREAAKVVTLSDATFKDVTGSGVVLVDFSAEWCGYCKMQKPTLANLAAQYAGRVTFAEVDFDTNKEAVGAHNVTGLPTLILFRDGKVYKRMVGLQEEAQLRDVLDAALRG